MKWSESLTKLQTWPYLFFWDKSSLTSISTNNIWKMMTTISLGSDSKPSHVEEVVLPSLTSLLSFRLKNFIIVAVMAQSLCLEAVRRTQFFIIFFWWKIKNFTKVAKFPGNFIKTIDTKIIYKKNISIIAEILFENPFILCSFNFFLFYLLLFHHRGDGELFPKLP